MRTEDIIFFGSQIKHMYNIAGNKPKLAKISTASVQAGPFESKSKILLSFKEHYTSRYVDMAMGHKIYPS